MIQACGTVVGVELAPINVATPVEIQRAVSGVCARASNARPDRDGRADSAVIIAS